MDDSLIKLGKEVIRAVVRGDGVPGTLGKADGTLDFTDPSGTVAGNKCWARIGQGSSATEIVVRCTSVTRQVNLPVIIGNQDGVPTVFRTDAQRADTFTGDRPMDVPNHAWIHDRLSADPLYITGLAFLPLQAIPATPAGMTVQVQQGFYRYSNVESVFPTTVSSSLSSYVPATGQHFVILCINRGDNTLAVVDGSSSAAPVTGNPFTPTAVLGVVSTLAATHYPLCAIRLYAGQTAITAQDIFMDLRFWGGEVGTIAYNDGEGNPADVVTSAATDGTSDYPARRDHVHGIADHAVTNPKFRQSGQLSVVGRSAASTGDVADIATTPATDAVLRESGSTLGFGTVATGGIAAAAVTDSKLRNSAALSIIGRAPNSSGSPADITATATSDAVLRESGSSLSFGTVATAGIANDAITNAKLANMTTKTYKGRTAGTTGDPEDVAAATLAADIQASIDHGSIGGLADDDHAQYALLLGRSGGQTLIGGTASGNDLTLKSTSNATKGNIFFGNAGTTTYDEVNERFGIGTASPAVDFEISASAPTQRVTQTGTNQVGQVGFYESTTLYGYIQMRGSTAASLSNTLRVGAQQAGSQMAFLTVATERMRIDEAGFVGIGTDDPSALFHVHKTAAAGAEELARFTVSDDATGYLKIVNTTTGDNLFNPGIETLQSATGASRFDLVKITTDTGTTPAMILDARTAAGAAVATRPLFDFRTFGTSKMLIETGGVTLANTMFFAADIVRARDSGGLSLEDDGGNVGVFVEDGGQVGIGGITSPTSVLSIKAGTSSDFANVGGVLSVDPTVGGNVGTGEDVLSSFSVPANTLAVNGQSIWFEACGATAANGNTKTLRVRFGTSGTGLILTHTTSANNQKWVIRGRVVRTGAATQKGYATSIISNVGSAAGVETGLDQTLSGAITFEITGEATSNNDLTLDTLVVGYDDNNS